MKRAPKRVWLVERCAQYESTVDAVSALDERPSRAMREDWAKCGCRLLGEYVQVKKREKKRR